MQKSKNREWLKGRNKLLTGFCSNGHCEGTKHKTAGGKPMKACPFWQTCPCTCHQKIDEMYELADLPREPPEQSPEYQEYIDKVHLEMELSMRPVDDSVAIHDPLSSPVGESPGDDTSEPTIPHSNGDRGTIQPIEPPAPAAVFHSTPTGRRARGQLEFDVLKVCYEFTQEVYEWEHCTPKLVAERVGIMYGAEPPSTGAINAVWDRWEKLQFASQAKKPSRFTGFLVEMDDPAVKLQEIKAKAKRNRKRVKAEIKRGALRPRKR